MENPDYSISTPENVDLHLELAGIANRILAASIDTTISFVASLGVMLTGIIIVMFLVQAGISTDDRNMIVLIISMVGVFSLFIITFAYYILFEGLWSGQTPGKRIAQIRVIETNGQPVSWSAVFIRNIVRALDTGLFLIGLLVMLVNKSEKRIGDLAAGTLVIRERKPENSKTAIEFLHGDKTEIAIDVGRISPQEYELINRFLRRRKELTDKHRPEVAEHLAHYLRDKLAGSLPEEESPSNAEAFIEKVYLSYQARAADE